MNRRAALVPFALALSGCAIFTKPTQTVCIPRQEFINVWGVIEELARLWFADEDRKADPARTQHIARAKALARRIQISARAKITYEETEVDWAAVKELLGILVGLAPL